MFQRFQRKGERSCLGRRRVDRVMIPRGLGQLDFYSLVAIRICDCIVWQRCGNKRAVTSGRRWVRQKCDRRRFVKRTYARRPVAAPSRWSSAIHAVPPASQPRTKQIAWTCCTRLRFCEPVRNKPEHCKSHTVPVQKRVSSAALLHVGPESATCGIGRALREQVHL